MVIIVRHGIINIENKPCRDERRAVKRENTEETTATECQHAQTRSNNTAPEVVTEQTYRRIPTPRPLTGSGSLSKGGEVTSSLTSQQDAEGRSADEDFDTVPVPSGRASLSNHCNPLSFEIELTCDRKSHESASQPSPLSRSVARSYSCFLGCKLWKLLLLYVIFSMCILYQGCSCLVCPAGPDRRVSWYPSINDTKVGITPGQCLTMTGEITSEICSKNTKDLLNEREVMLRNSKFNTKFCGLPLYNVLSSSEKEEVTHGSKDLCTSVLQQVEDLDNYLKALYISFSDVVDRMDCRQEDSYSVKWNCVACREAYKRWLCSVNVTLYFGDQDDVVIKPCVDFCDHVTQRCPFFRLFGEGLIGEPGFICKENTNVHPTRAAATYGKPGCCYKPCHIYDYTVTTDKYEPCFLNNITSNCNASYHAALSNAATSSTSSILMTLSTPVTSFISTPHRLWDSSPYLFILSVTISWLLHMGNVYSSIDLT